MHKMTRVRFEFSDTHVGIEQIVPLLSSNEEKRDWRAESNLKRVAKRVSQLAASSSRSTEGRSITSLFLDVDV